MSVIIDYLKLLPKALKNADTIINGVINNVRLKYGMLSQEEQEEIIKRRLICATCPFMSSNAVVNPAINYTTNRLDEHCIWCGCNIELKTSALEEECGIADYNKDHPDSPLEIKWNSFQKTEEDND